MRMSVFMMLKAYLIRGALKCLSFWVTQESYQWKDTEICEYMSNHHFLETKDCKHAKKAGTNDWIHSQGQKQIHL